MHELAKTIFKHSPDLHDYDFAAATEKRLKSVEKVIEKYKNAIDRYIEADDEDLRTWNIDLESSCGMRGAKQEQVHILRNRLGRFVENLAGYNVLDVGFHSTMEDTKMPTITALAAKKMKRKFKLGIYALCNNKKYTNSGLLDHTRDQSDVWHLVIHWFSRISHDQ